LDFRPFPSTYWLRDGTSNPKGIGYETFPYTFIPIFNKIFLFDKYHAFEVNEGFDGERRQIHGDFMDNFSMPIL
jgi:hypothetical protein